MILPKKVLPAVTESPRVLILFGKPKCGKTTAVSMLPGNLIIDLERRGTDYISALKVKAHNLDELKEVADAIQGEIDKTGKKPYQFITIDTITMLEEMVLPLAKALYKNTPMGKNWNGDDVRTLPQGAGYLYFREAFFKIKNTFEDLTDYLILIGHLKDKMIDKEGKEFNVMELDLTGKTQRLAAADADAIGYVYRKDSQTIVNFATSEGLVAGSRNEHLKGKEVVLVEEVDGKLKSYWERIYPDLIK